MTHRPLRFPARCWIIVSLMAVCATAKADAAQGTQPPEPRGSGPTMLARVDLAGVRAQPGLAPAGAPNRSLPIPTPAEPLDLKRLIHQFVVGR